MAKEGRRDFDAAAAQWDEQPRRVKLGSDIVEAIRKEVPLDSRMVALDYGCGSGLVTLGLQPYVQHITGGDSSTGMLEILDGKVKAAGLTNVDGILLDLEVEVKLEKQYDLIVSSMTMHHVEDVAKLIESLAASLKPGGWLALADLQAEDGSFHDDSTGVFHHGFEPAFLSGAFAKSGLSQVHTAVAAVIEKPSPDGPVRHYPVVLCVGKR
ncbi:class I SAM-dependent methyltransferase [Geomonas sp. Red32]|uniref:class I SAM-dependent DNA methyltransferase n=1 Tax=Geomonas sp. Red32 TaxID=2912856 RepID=UPI00202CCAB7|nr:class I SAM-dependent methyltransferase [Geomonas sp. Red32]MCM0082981.1 class I SAM-dependent methyltransferase [Geomonas sp. Red32]